MPVSTWALISRQSASVWKFIGVPESVPIPIVAFDSIHCPSDAFANRISWSVAEKYESRWNPTSDFWTSAQICGPKSAFNRGILEPLRESRPWRERETPGAPR